MAEKKNDARVGASLFHLFRLFPHVHKYIFFCFFTSEIYSSNFALLSLAMFQCLLLQKSKDTICCPLNHIYCVSLVLKIISLSLSFSLSLFLSLSFFLSATMSFSIELLTHGIPISHLRQFCLGGSVRRRSRIPGGHCPCRRWCRSCR